MAGFAALGVVEVGATGETVHPESAVIIEVEVASSGVAVAVTETGGSLGNTGVVVVGADARVPVPKEGVVRTVGVVGVDISLVGIPSSGDAALDAYRS